MVMWLRRTGSAITAVGAIAICAVLSIPIDVGSATPGRDPQVTGEAKFLLEEVGGSEAQVRVNAHGNPARGHVFLSQSHGLPSFSGRVTCINVVGNRASVGGVIEDSPSDPSLVGQGFVEMFEDNGSPGRGDFSQLTALGGTPPATCPPPVHPVFQVDQGNYVVNG